MQACDRDSRKISENTGPPHKAINSGQELRAVIYIDAGIISNSRACLLRDHFAPRHQHLLENEFFVFLQYL